MTTAEPAGPNPSPGPSRRQVLAAGGATALAAWAAPTIVSAPAASAATVAPCVRGVTATVISGPLSQRLAMTATHAYVSRPIDSILIVDLAAGVVSGTIPLNLGLPAGGAVAIQGTDLYVVIPGGVRIYDLVTQALTGAIPIATTTSELAVGATHAYLTRGTSAAEVHVIDLATSTVAAPITVGANPTGVAATATGAYVTCTAGVTGTVAVIDAATNSVTDTIAVGFAPRWVATNATRAYVVNDGDGTVSVFDLATNTVIATVPIGPAGAIKGVAATSTHVYFANTDAGVVVMDALTNVVTETIPVAGFPYGLATNGTHVCVTDPIDGTTTVVDLCTTTQPP